MNSLEWNPSAYGEVVADLVREIRLAELGPGTPNEAARPTLAALRPDSLFLPRATADAGMAAACLAGLWLYHDFLDQSHTISQSIETPTGSYWHGIMHRREPDYSNSKYWFRRVGAHPVFVPLHKAAAEAAAMHPHPCASALLERPAWDPFAFVDLCQQAAHGDKALDAFCRRVQLCEWRLLFDWCYRGAVGER